MIKVSEEQTLDSGRRYWAALMEMMQGDPPRGEAALAMQSLSENLRNVLSSLENFESHEAVAIQLLHWGTAFDKVRAFESVHESPLQAAFTIACADFLIDSLLLVMGPVTDENDALDALFERVMQTRPKRGTLQ